MIRPTLIFGALLATGCFRYTELPAASTPEPTVPVVDDLERAPDGTVPVTLDVVHGHALAQEVDSVGTIHTVTISSGSATGRSSNESKGGYVAVQESTQETERAHAVCMTPCVANLPPGPHTFRFLPVSGLGPDVVEDHVGFDVGRRPLVVRAQLQEDAPPNKVGALLLYMLATGLVVGGSTSLAFGSEQEPGWFVGGGITIGLGVVAGIVGVVVDAATVGHRRRGASTYWEPSGPSYQLRRP